MRIPFLGRGDRVLAITRHGLRHAELIEEDAIRPEIVRLTASDIRSYHGFDTRHRVEAIFGYIVVLVIGLLHRFTIPLHDGDTLAGLVQNRYPAPGAGRWRRTFSGAGPLSGRRGRSPPMGVRL